MGEGGGGGKEMRTAQEDGSRLERCEGEVWRWEQPREMWGRGGGKEMRTAQEDGSRLERGVEVGAAPRDVGEGGR